MQTQLIGILNVTPDSFSDGGSYGTIEKALAQAEILVAAGASVIDIGGESTRPGAVAISQSEEWARLNGILQAIRSRWNSGEVRISVDTYHPDTARKVIALGADIINDVSGCESEAMQQVLAEAPHVPVIIMHNLGVPARKDVVIPEGKDPVAEVMEWAERRIAQLERKAIARERVIFDPGIGFGKNASQSIALLHSIERFKVLGVPLCIGHSRKSFLRKFSSLEPKSLDIETIAVSLRMSLKEVEYLRVHDVEGHKRALSVFSAV